MFSEYSLPPTCKQTLIQTTENTVEKETVIISDKQAPVTQKQKATDHIDEELRLAIFKTLKLSQILFSQKEDLKDIRRRVSRSFAGQFPILFGLCSSVFDFYFTDALFSPCTVCYRDQLKCLIIFLPDENEGHSPFCHLKFPTSPLCANGVARACLGYKYAN